MNQTQPGIVVEQLAEGLVTCLVSSFRRAEKKNHDTRRVEVVRVPWRINGLGQMSRCQPVTSTIIDDPL